MKNDERIRRIAVTRSETRKSGDNYTKLEFGLESDLGDETWEDAFRNSHRVLQAAVNAAFNSNGLEAEPAKAEPPKPEVPDQDDPYVNLAWRQSEKNARLKTILVEPALLTDPIAKKLYDVCKTAGKNGVRVSGRMYKLSEFNQREYLQSWGSSSGTS